MMEEENNKVSWCTIRESESDLTLTATCLTHTLFFVERLFRCILSPYYTQPKLTLWHFSR